MTPDEHLMNTWMLEEQKSDKTLPPYFVCFI